MLSLGGSYQRDIYNCVVCDCYISPADRYCRDCGSKITQVDVYLMEKRLAKSSSKSGPSHGPFSELIRCVQCEAFVAACHQYCKRCGRRFSDGDKFEMIRPDKSPYVGPAVFVALVLFFWCLVLFD